MVSTTTTLLSLPTEVILIISDFLPPDGVLALKLTRRSFNSMLPLTAQFKDTTFSMCAHLAIRTYLSRPEPKPSRLRCIRCKEVYPLKSFESTSSPACAPLAFHQGTQQTNVLELPQRLCAFHVGSLARVVHTDIGGRNEWTSCMGEMCMHCGEIQAWKKCDCKCGSCAILPVRTYTRYLNNTRECGEFLFWRDFSKQHAGNPDGQLMVREKCRYPGKLEWGQAHCECWLTPADGRLQNTIIDLPVYFESHDAPLTADNACSVISRPRDMQDALLGLPRPR